MGHHRGDRRGPSRPVPETERSHGASPTVGADTEGTASVDVHDATTETIPAIDIEHAGVPLPDLATTPPARGTTPGKRKAVKKTRVRVPLAKGVPSPSVLLGTATLALAIGGAVVTTSEPELTASKPAIAEPATAHHGTSKAVSVGSLPDRDRPISRDSDRDALEKTASSKLVKAAEKQTKERNAALGRLAQAAEKQAAELAKNQWVAPLQPVNLTARFGEYGLWASYHTGLDFNGTTGQPIHAIANGEVTEVGYDGSYGNKTVVTLEDGTEIWYCHQSAYAVSEGDTVAAGDVIGSVGSTGNSTGSHLHVEVRPGGGDPVDPYEALIVHGVPLG